MTTLIPMPQIPDKLTDVEARKMFEQYAPQIRALGDEIVRNNTRAEQGQRAYEENMAKANAHFGVDNGLGFKEVPGGIEGMNKILDERLIGNAGKARQFFTDLQAAQEKVAAITKASAQSPR